MMKALKKRRKGGFTLIELIVVIAILAILALIAIPRLGGFTDSADTSANLATARTIASAITMAEASGNTVDATEINKYLSGTTVTLGTASGTGWVVQVSPLRIWAPGIATPIITD